jgi:hypothetical protein
VLAQSFDSWELLLVDDGSEDQGTSIAREYASQFGPKIRYLEHDHNDHRGTSASRNIGLRAASGTFIAFLDADECTCLINSRHKSQFSNVTRMRRLCLVTALRSIASMLARLATGRCETGFSRRRAECSA